MATLNPILAAVRAARETTPADRLYPAWGKVLRAAVAARRDRRAFADATDAEVQKAAAVVTRLAAIAVRQAASSGS